MLAVSIVRSERRNGKPHQIVIGYLGTIEQNRVGDIHARHHFWRGVGARLDALALDRTQRKKIEDGLAAVIAPLSRNEVAAVKRVLRVLWRDV
jgi:hypothetical protein